MKYFLFKLTRFCLGAYYSLQFTVAVLVPRSLKWLSCNKRQWGICNARNFYRTCTFPHVTQKVFEAKKHLPEYVLFSRTFFWLWDNILKFKILTEIVYPKRSSKIFKFPDSNAEDISHFIFDIKTFDMYRNVNKCPQMLLYVDKCPWITVNVQNFLNCPSNVRKKPKITEDSMCHIQTRKISINFNHHLLR